MKHTCWNCGNFHLSVFDEPCAPCVYTNPHINWRPRLRSRILAVIALVMLAIALVVGACAAWAYLAGAFKPVPRCVTVIDKPIMLHNRVKYKIEEREDWMITRAVVLDWWSNRTVSVSENGKETIWY